MPAPRRRPRAFTLVEMVVVIVIVSVLVAALSFAFARFQNSSRDKAAEAQLTLVSRGAAGIAATSNGTYTVASLQAAAAEAQVLSAAPLTAAGLTVVQDGASSGPGVLSVTVNSPADDRAWLALRSSTGNCATAVLSGTSVDISVRGDLSQCSGSEVAAANGSGSGGESGGGSGGGSGGDSGTVAAPTNLSGSSSGGNVTLTWDGAADADYRVTRVDTSQTWDVTGPTWSGQLPVPTAANVDYQFQVAALSGTTESAPSAVTVRVHCASGDMLACAQPIPADDWTSAVVSNVGTTTETNELSWLRDDPAHASYTVWWEFVPTKTRGYQFYLAPSGAYGIQYSRLTVWQGPAGAASPPELNQTPLASSYNSSGHNTTVLLEAGRRYWVRVGNRVGYNNPGTFTLQVQAAAAQDTLAAAAVIDPAAATWASGTVSNEHATVTPNELSSLRDDAAHASRTVWWRIQPAVTAGYQFYLAPVAPQIKESRMTVWQGPATATSPADLGSSPLAASYNASLHNLSVLLRAGNTYWVRVGNRVTYDYPGAFTLTMKRAQVNDVMAAAVPLNPPTADWTTEVTTNEHGSVEPGELSDLRDDAAHATRTLWWTFTPTRTGSHQLFLSPTGTPALANSRMTVWRGPAAAATPPELVQTPIASSFGSGASSLTVALTAGEKYWIRVGNRVTYDNPGGFTLRLVQP